MSFESIPTLTVGIHADEWILARPLVYHTDNCERYVVPEGFITDLASIPRVLQPLFPVNGRHRAAAILHDWLYVVKPVARHRADELFLEAMKNTGVRWSQRWTMYLGVRLGGWVAWDNKGEWA